jgi:hypothetical protein
VIKNVGVNVGAIIPTDGSHSFIDFDGPENVRIVPDFVEYGTMQILVKVDFARGPVSKSQPHPKSS